MDRTLLARAPLAGAPFTGTLLAGALLASLAGCTVGPDFTAPSPSWSAGSWFDRASTRDPHASRQDAGVHSVAAATALDPVWWNLFHDTELTALEQRLAAGNLDLQLADARLAQSRAQLGVLHAAALPQIDANGSYTREKLSGKGVLGLFGGAGASPGAASNGLGGTNGGFPNLNGLSDPFDLYQYGFDASWELDLWGRVRRQTEGGRAQVAASVEARRDRLVTAQAELARDYVQLRGTQQTIRITRDDAATAGQSLDLAQRRAASGIGAELDVANAAAQLETTRSALPGLAAQESDTINAIALLLGAPPETLTAELSAQRAIPPVPRLVPIGLPSELARRRPDIREAEARLHAATASVGVAVADFYPRVTLSGSDAIQALQFGSLGSWGLANSYSIGPSISLPIFQGGRLRRTLELRQGEQREAALTYQRTVLAALHDVNSALTHYAAEQQQAAILGRAVTQNQRALALARRRYAAGRSGFLDVLVAERAVLDTQRQEVASTARISTNLVQLYKALGGGWSSSAAEKPGLAGG